MYGVEHNQSLENITVTEGRLNAFNAIENLMSTCGECVQAFGGNIEEITNSTGKLTWFDDDTNGITSLRYKDLDDSDWIEVENIESGLVIENLNICSYYEFQTKTNCGNNPDVEYSYSRVFKTIGCCEIPSGIEILTSDQFLTVQWEDVQSANNFVVEWRNVADTIWTVVDVGQENSFTIESFSDCEFFEVRIKSECDITNNESEFSKIINFNTNCEGCTKNFCPFEFKITDDEWIESVEIENVFTNTSGPNEEGYGVFLGQFDIVLTADEVYTIILTPGHSGIQYLEFFSAYIDYNQNGEFEDNESIFISAEGSFEPVMGSFTVPNDAVDGFARMRIVMRYDEFNGPCDVFGFNYGEIEEYCVNIIGNNDCPVDFGVIVTDTNLTSLTFEFKNFNGVDVNLIAYREKGAQDFDTLMSASNVILVSDLKICTEYEYKIGYFCQGITTYNSEINEILTACEVGTADIDLLAFKIYPNPSFGDFVVEFEYPIQNKATIELFSIDGKTVKTINKIKEGSKTLLIDTQGLPSGVYFLKLNSDSKFVAKKWIKY